MVLARLPGRRRLVVLIKTLHWLFDALPSFAGLLLATFAFALVFAEEIEDWLRTRRRVRMFLTVALAVIGVAAFASDVIQRSEAETEHALETRDQNRQLGDLNNQLQLSELRRTADTKFLEGQLSVFAQFTPAIFKLAQATENNTRMQYETKKLTNQQLFDKTIVVVKQLRALRQKYADTGERQWQENVQAAATAKASGKQYEPSNDLMKSLWFTESADLAQIMPDAIYVRNEMLNLKIAEPVMGEAASTGFMHAIFSGGGFGTGREDVIATYLEIMAKQIPLTGK
jgi:hypothetical protein